MTSQKTQHVNACSYWLTTYNKAKGQIINTVNYHKNTGIRFHSHYACDSVKETQVLAIDETSIKILNESLTTMNLFDRFFCKSPRQNVQIAAKKFSKFLRIEIQSQNREIIW